jgi:hypothetical protein
MTNAMPARAHDWTLHGDGQDIIRICHGGSVVVSLSAERASDLLVIFLMTLPSSRSCEPSVKEC